MSLEDFFKGRLYLPSQNLGSSASLIFSSYSSIFKILQKLLHLLLTK